jgi:hypothetical protein
MMSYYSKIENLYEIEDEIIDEQYDFSTIHLVDDESQAPEVIPEETKKAQDTAENEKTLDEMIVELPNNFPEANSVLKGEIFPLIVEMDAGMQDYYIDSLKKKFSVGKQTIKESIKAFKQEMTPALIDIEEDEKEEEIDPEIIEAAKELALDPEIFKNRIETVNNLGIINEKRNIGMITMTIDSRLNPMGVKGANVLAAKNTGESGAGKSATLMSTLKIYSKKCYHLIDNGSAKSIYNMGKNALQHKTLILNEAFTFQGNSSSDSEFSHIVRCLLSEGSVTYQYTSFDADGNKITKIQTVYGPTPLITTSIYSSFEKQLDDRMFSIHPNISSQQTSDVISIDAQAATGINNELDEKDIKVWRTFHDSLEVLDVVIPFAPEIHAFLVQGGDLPISARRAFKRVLVSIKTISLLHQKQREKDDQGRLIAEISDYALAYQLIDNAFRESLGGGKYTDRRIQLVDKLSPVAPKDLAKAEGVSGAAITGWSKNWLEKGVLTWCDDQGVGIKKKDLKKMKHSGKAYLKVFGVNRLPTPFELTDDEKWDLGGELNQMYDLELDSGGDVLSAESGMDADLNTFDDSEEVENSGYEDGGDDGVKVLNHRTNEEVKEMVRESTRRQREEFDPNDPAIQELYDEFSEILKPYVPLDMNVA